MVYRVRRGLWILVYDHKRLFYEADSFYMLLKQQHPCCTGEARIFGI